MYLGVNKEGVMRIDIKTKEVDTKVLSMMSFVMMSHSKVLDMWEYRVLKNWAFTTNTFMLVSELFSIVAHTGLNESLNVYFLAFPTVKSCVFS